MRPGAPCSKNLQRAASVPSGAGVGVSDPLPAPEIASLPRRGEISPSVVDGLPIPIVVSSVSDDRIVRVNPEFTHAYGHSSESVEGLTVTELHYEAADRALTLERHANGGMESVEVRLRSSRGDRSWARADVSRFDMDGRDVLLTTFHDIRDRKEAEAQLEEMARFPDMNPGPVLRLDMDGVIRRFNVAARSLFGVESEGRCFWDLCPDLSLEARERALEGAPTVREDVRIEGRWYRLTLTRPDDTDQIFVFGSDITNEKAAEQELAERARFPAMNPGPVARVDRAGTVLRANPAAATVFGRDSIAGLSWLELCPGMDAGLWDRVVTESHSAQHEAQIGERWYTFALRHEPVADQVFVYGSDTTELKAAERALAELARFPDMNPGPVCRLDRRGTVLLANPAARELFGSEELIGASWLELVPAVSAERWEKILAAEEATVVETRFGSRDLVLTHRAGPEGLYVFAYGSDVTRQKAAELALRQTEKMATLGTLAAGVAHELNNPAAAARRAADQLEGSFAALQSAQHRLAASAPWHEVQAVLADLGSFAREAATRVCGLGAMDRARVEDDLEAWLERHGVDEAWTIAPVFVEAGSTIADLEALRDRVGEERIAVVTAWKAHALRVYGLLHEVRQGAARISEIVGAMKDYSYLGQAPVQQVDVNEGIRSTLVILRSRLREGIHLDQQLSAELPKIEAFGSELNQVWTNLLDNAIQALEGTGTIRIKTSTAGDRVRVEIEDDGPGIPAEHLDRVFDAFFTTKPPGEGTGLGLHTSYNIVVEKHGGTIRVDSHPGRTRFSVELPVAGRAVARS